MGIALLAVCCLLFQQLAVAAVACERVFGAPEQAAAPCHGTGAEQPGEPDVLCSKHCSPDSAIASDARNASVPALALPPSPIMAAPALAAAMAWPARPRPPSLAPPTLLQHARLLI